MDVAINALLLVARMWPEDCAWDWARAIEHVFVKVQLELPEEPEFYEIMLAIKNKSRLDVIEKLTEVLRA